MSADQIETMYTTDIVGQPSFSPQKSKQAVTPPPLLPLDFYTCISKI